MEQDTVRHHLIEKIHALNPRYQDAVKWFESENNNAGDVLYSIYQKLVRFDETTSSANHAIYIVAQCEVLLGDFAANYGVIKEYRDAKDKLEDYDRRKALANG